MREVRRIPELDRSASGPFRRAAVEILCENNVFVKDIMLAWGYLSTGAAISSRTVVFACFWCRVSYSVKAASDWRGDPGGVLSHVLFG